MRFDELALAEPLVRAVAAEGYTKPMPIQVAAIPHILDGRDLLACAQTGSGKTCAFALPILQRLSAGADARRPRQGGQGGHGGSGGDGARKGRGGAHAHHPIRALVLCPTRELASQIVQSFAAYGRHLHLRHTAIFGGVSQFHQERALRAGVDILVATPGRLLDLMGQGFVDLQSVQVLVLDEADRMLDMGFIPDIRKIVKRMPASGKRQTLLFSATMPADIRDLAASLLHDPVNVQVDPVASTVETVSQSVYHVARKDKPALLTSLIERNGMGRTLVFTRTKHGADRVVKALSRVGIRAQAIHGNKSQNARTRAIDSFKGSKPPVLVATDIASRGIDIDDITHVINFDIPNVPETYVHRIGRTARAGASGVAISFCDHEERPHLKAIERLIRLPIEVNRDQPDLTTAAPPPDREREHGPSAPRERRGAPGGGRRRSGRGGGPAARPGAGSKGAAPRSAAPSAPVASAGPSRGRNQRSFQQRGRARRPRAR